MTTFIYDTIFGFDNITNSNTGKFQLFNSVFITLITNFSDKVLVISPLLTYITVLSIDECK